MDLNNEFNALKSHIEEVARKFVDFHIDKQIGNPADYSHDVKSFCVLSHAAFEEFMEIVALKTLDEAVKLFKRENKLSRPIVTLIHFKAEIPKKLFSEELEDDLLEEVPGIFTYICDRLDEVKDAFSKQIHKNHGVSVKYLKKIFMPVAIDIPSDENLLNSLKQLAIARGSYAHKYKERGRVQQSIAPEQAKIYVFDCINLCEQIKNKAHGLF